MLFFFCYKIEHAFNTTKVSHIFYYLLKDKHIRLLDGQNIRPVEEIKGKWIKQLPLIKFGYHGTILTTIQQPTYDEPLKRQLSNACFI